MNALKSAYFTFALVACLFYHVHFLNELCCFILQATYPSQALSTSTSIIAYENHCLGSIDRWGNDLWEKDSCYRLSLTNILYQKCALPKACFTESVLYRKLLPRMFYTEFDHRTRLENVIVAISLCCHVSSQRLPSLLNYGSASRVASRVMYIGSCWVPLLRMKQGFKALLFA